MTTTFNSHADLDLFSVEHAMDPFATLDRLRDEAAAIYMPQLRRTDQHPRRQADDERLTDRRHGHCP